MIIDIVAFNSAGKFLQIESHWFQHVDLKLGFASHVVVFQTKDRWTRCIKVILETLLYNKC